MTHRNKEALSAKSPKLLDQVWNELRFMHYSKRTDEAYTQWIRRFIYFTRNAIPVRWVAGTLTIAPDFSCGCAKEWSSGCTETPWLKMSKTPGFRSCHLFCSLTLRWPRPGINPQPDLVLPASRSGLRPRPGSLHGAVARPGPDHGWCPAWRRRRCHRPASVPAGGA